jgi:uncharacterized protein YggU (UPF0235/DUF167 family)
MTILVKVHPQNTNPRIEKKVGIFHIYVKEAVLEGRANQAVIEKLAEYLKIKKYQIILKKGLKSKNKIFVIN